MHDQFGSITVSHMRKYCYLFIVCFIGNTRGEHSIYYVGGPKIINNPEYNINITNNGSSRLHQCVHCFIL